MVYGFHPYDFVSQAAQPGKQIAFSTAQVANPGSQTDAFLQPGVVDFDAVIIQPREPDAQSVEQAERLMARMSGTVVVGIV